MASAKDYTFVCGEQSVPEAIADCRFLIADWASPIAVNQQLAIDNRQWLPVLIVRHKVGELRQAA